MRTLVTGGGGFVGSHLVERLEADGHDVVAARRRDHDLTSADDTARLFADARPELVFHLAAEVGGIGANRANPGRYFYANMAMGLHVIEASRSAGVDKVVQVGTVCAYPKHTPVPFSEAALWDGYPEETNAPYGVAKKSLLVMLQGYREQYGLAGIYLLPVNLYGPGDNFSLETSHVVPALIRKFCAAKALGLREVEAWGTGSASREFLYVDDAARGIVLATERYDGPEPVNLGAGHEISIRDLAELIARLTGFEGVIRWDPTRPDGQPRRMLDTRRAAERFGFRAEVGLEEGLRRTIDCWVQQDG
jgi:GDP-L-fucose synthase